MLIIFRTKGTTYFAPLKRIRKIVAQNTCQGVGDRNCIRLELSKLEFDSKEVLDALREGSFDGWIKDFRTSKDSTFRKKWFKVLDMDYWFSEENDTDTLGWGSYDFKIIQHEQEGE